MNWFARNLRKIAYPYGYNVCPNCTESVLLDFWWEKQGEHSDAIGKCPSCQKELRIIVYPQEETIGFKYSDLTPVSHQQYVKLKLQGTPEIQITSDENHEAVTPLNTVI